jgi:hypothetical protein
MRTYYREASLESRYIKNLVVIQMIDFAKHYINESLSCQTARTKRKNVEGGNQVIFLSYLKCVVLVTPIFSPPPPSESQQQSASRVARWHIFKPKIPIWVNFGGPWVGKCWYILWPFGIFYGYLGYFMTIWYIFCSFGTFCPVLVLCTNKNLATLSASHVVVAGWLVHAIL